MHRDAVIPKIPAPHLLKQGQLQLAGASFREIGTWRLGAHMGSRPVRGARSPTRRNPAGTLQLTMMDIMDIRSHQHGQTSKPSSSISAVARRAGLQRVRLGTGPLANDARLDKTSTGRAQTRSWDSGVGLFQANAQKGGRCAPWMIRVGSVRSVGDDASPALWRPVC